MFKKGGVQVRYEASKRSVNCLGGGGGGAAFDVF